MPVEIVPTAVIVPAKSPGTTGTSNTSVGTIPNSARVQYTAGIVGWHIKALKGYHCAEAQSDIMY